MALRLPGGRQPLFMADRSWYCRGITVVSDMCPVALPSPKY